MRLIVLMVGMTLLFLCRPTVGQENLIGPITEEKTWRFEAQNGGEGKMEIGEDEITVTVLKTTGTPWHVQALLPNLTLAEGREYTLKFELKVDSSQLIKVSGMIDQEDWHQIGLFEELYPPSEYKAYELQFRATDIAEGGKNRISFVMGDSRGTVSLRKISLVEKD